MLVLIQLKGDASEVTSIPGSVFLILVACETLEAKFKVSVQAEMVSV